MGFPTLEPGSIRKALRKRAEEAPENISRVRLHLFSLKRQTFWVADAFIIFIHVSVQVGASLRGLKPVCFIDSWKPYTLGPQSCCHSERERMSVRVRVCQQSKLAWCPPAFQQNYLLKVEKTALRQVISCQDNGCLEAVEGDHINIYALRFCLSLMMKRVLWPFMPTRKVFKFLSPLLFFLKQFSGITSAAGWLVPS